MRNFTISLAGFCVEINSIFETTRIFCRDYLCEGVPEFSVTISPENITFEREKSAKEDLLEGIPVRQFSDEYLETLAVYRKICAKLLERETLLFHGSAIAVDGVAYLFTAKSGTGKSTHTALWRQVFKDRAVMINDDKPLLKLTSDGVLVCGTPWNGKHGLGCNKMVPLKAICILERAEQNTIHPVDAAEALPMLLQQSFRTGTPNGTVLLFDILDKLTKRVPLYRLGCNMDPQAAVVSYEGMKG
ncbi:MAG: hypothetical protein J6J12_04740 [Oscillospiraceae bacterium]|nr:hypothetical protein [Lachnospiraceae bacterium]MBP3684254.1 hypothetical protein [Oscillospiraceae bacterium]